MLYYVVAIQRKGQTKEKRRYVVKILRLPSEYRPRLDELCKASGTMYSKVVVQYWRTLRRSSGKQKRLKDGSYVSVDPCRKTVFLSNGVMQKLLPNDPGKLLHSHSCDAVVDRFFEAVKSTRVRRANGAADAQYPRKLKRWGAVTFKASAIRLKAGNLLLSTGEKKRPIAVPWTDSQGNVRPVPLSVEIGIDRQKEHYELRAMYVDGRAVQAPIGTGIAGIDIGELRIAAVYDGEGVVLHSGRKLRSRNHYSNRRGAKLQTRISGKKRGSKRALVLKRAKRRMQARIRRQNQDQLRKQAKDVVSTLRLNGVQTVAVGDLSDIRTRMDFGKKMNQKLHGWLFRYFLAQLASQAVRHGLTLKVIDESYTSKTCPWTGVMKKPRGRLFRNGLHRMDRDGVGAVNIRAKYLESVAGKGTAYGRAPSLPWTPVLVGMAPTTRGIRFPLVSRSDLRNRP
jgi:putative transposase